MALMAIAEMSRIGEVPTRAANANKESKALFREPFCTKILRFLNMQQRKPGDWPHHQPRECDIHDSG